VSRQLPVSFVPRAKRETAAAGRWWRANREKAPLAFEEELEKALDLISRQSAIGARATNMRLSGVRKLLLGRVQYHLYYRVVSTESRIEVLAIWHAARGEAPPI
jgi:plasmid stabilization system protein ParE